MCSHTPRHLVKWPCLDGKTHQGCETSQSMTCTLEVSIPYVNESITVGGQLQLQLVALVLTSLTWIPLPQKHTGGKRLIIIEWLRQRDQGGVLGHMSQLEINTPLHKFGYWAELHQQPWSVLFRNDDRLAVGSCLRRGYYRPWSPESLEINCGMNVPEVSAVFHGRTAPNLITCSSTHVLNRHPIPIQDVHYTNKQTDLKKTTFNRGNKSIVTYREYIQMLWWWHLSVHSNFYWAFGSNLRVLITFTYMSGL